jgi:hypothetical protein
MTEDELAATEAAHVVAPDDGWEGHCGVDAEEMPCEAARLAAEVRRLRRLLGLSEASRGVPSIPVGMD